MASVVSQPHIEVDIERPLVTKVETDELMASMGFASVQLVLDLHDENVVRLPETGELAVIDPSISLARQGTWAALKLAEVGYPTPPDAP